MMTSPASCDKDPLDVLVAANLAALKARIAATGRDPASVRIVAVTKGFDATYVRVAQRCGLVHVGENYASEFLTKHAESPAGLTWHFLGPLQTNKIAALAKVADVLSALSRRREIDVLARQDRRVALDIQVDFTGRAERNGVALGELDDLVGFARSRALDVRGLMTVAPNDHDGARAAFAQLASAADRLGIVERSMGMSDDLELACEAGTTEIRVGRALFGPRPGH